MPSADHARLIALLRARPVAATATLAERRTAFERIGELFPLAADVRVEATRLGDLRLEWITAGSAVPGRVLLYLHGGAYVAGSCNTHRELASRLARAARARLLLPEYRLAPEHPFPAALHDAVATLRLLATSAREVLLAGDSAGGGLALATMLVLRDQGRPLPARCALIAPWVDLAGTAPSLTQLQHHDVLLEPALLARMACLYRHGADARHPLVSPLYGDLRGLPPLCVQAGSWDLLLDDAVRLHARARSAGVAAQLDVWEQMPHVWHLFAGMLEEGRDAIEGLGRFLRGPAG